LIVASLAVLAGPACSRPAPFFSVDNARAHVNRLAGTIGARPLGSEANRRAREYLIEQLRFYGFTVRVQEADAARAEYGLTAHVANIIAVHPGRDASAIALVAHYDSDDAAPGAADDGLGVAVCLEVGRLLASKRDRQSGLMVLLTDGEELGLLGAAALVNDPEVRNRVRAYINLDNAGSDAPAVLFQTGPGNRALLTAWSVAPAPRGGSVAEEVYQHLPNDTDFTIFKRAGIPGLNIGAVGDSYAYHTPRDTPDRLTDAVIRQMGENVLATAQAMDRITPDPADSEQLIYFDLASRTTVTWSVLGARIAGIAALAAGLVAWLHVVLWGWRTYRWRGIVLPIVWGIVGVAGAVCAMVAATALLRVSREVLHPWYAHPERLWTLLVLSAFIVVHLLFVIGARLPQVLQAPRHPSSVWMATLPVWLVAASAAQWIPSASYLWTIPLLTTAVPVAVAPAANGWIARLVAVLAFASASIVWLPECRELLAFSVAVFGRLPMVTPVSLYAFMLAAAGVMVIPPILALLVAGPAPLPIAEVPVWRRRAQQLLTPALTLAVVGAFAWAYLGEAYTHDRPLRRFVQYVADHGTSQAAWEVAGNEPGLDIHAAGAPTGWTASSGQVLPGVPVPPVPFPFAFRAPASVDPAPVSATGRSRIDGDVLRVDVNVTSTLDGATVLLLLPPGVEPSQSSIAGSVRNGSWRAAFVAPTGPVAFNIALPVSFEPRLNDIRVGLATRALPGGAGWLQQPAWLGQERTVWYARGLHVAPVAWAAPVAPPAQMTPAAALR
jgi:hypothetical protein